MLAFGVNGDGIVAVGQDAGQLLEGGAGNDKLEGRIAEGFDGFLADGQAVTVDRDQTENVAFDLKGGTGVDRLVFVGRDGEDGTRLRRK